MPVAPENETNQSQQVSQTEAVVSHVSMKPDFHLFQKTTSCLGNLGEVSKQFIPGVFNNITHQARVIGKTLVAAPEEQAVIHIAFNRGTTKATQAVDESKGSKVLQGIPGLENVPEIVDGLRLTLAERSVIAITNAERAKRGLKPLMPSRRLMESSRRHAAWMAATGVFRHGASAAAENIARGQQSSSAAMRAWMNSTGHRRNLLGSSHGQIGVGAYRSSGGQMYWCQQFTR